MMDNVLRNKEFHPDTNAIEYVKLSHLSVFRPSRKIDGLKSILTEYNVSSDDYDSLWLQNICNLSLKVKVSLEIIVSIVAYIIENELGIKIEDMEKLEKELCSISVELLRDLSVFESADSVPFYYSVLFKGDKSFNYILRTKGAKGNGRNNKIRPRNS